MAKSKKPAKKAAKKPAKKAAKKPAKKAAKKSSSNCSTITVCGKKRKLCWGKKKGKDGVTRRVIVSNKPA